MNASLPLVSIITPITESRQMFVPYINRIVKEQTYPNIEHIFIDGEKETIGEKRNWGCQRANGEIIVHMDSDDKYSTEWVEKSVFLLMQSKCFITGLKRAYFQDLVTKDTYLYSWTDPKTSFILGATMCYWKSYWETRKFPKTSLGEEYEFVTKCPKVIAHNYISDFLASIHKDNTSPRNLADYRFKKVNIEEHNLLTDEIH